MACGRPTNAGTTWNPVFDDQGSYSLGCVTLDPNNPLVVWVGSGENNSQRSVSYGDGVYKSLDGGTTWTNMGLKTSEHISMIVVDPRDSNVVWVAAQGPLWSSGGERGLYVTRDGGKTWSKAFETSADTGVTEVHLDPRNPDVMYATTYQRRRHVWTVINGGPESGLRKSTDGGKTWRTISNGLPKGDIGRIGLAIAPADPDTIYAVMDAAGKDSGTYRSTDAGENWEKRSDYKPSTGQYYNKLFADPKVVDRFYAMDTWMHVSEDGGKSAHRVGEKHKHVDNHVLWIDPDNTEHLLAGCDGGVYESFDRGATWRWFRNLPLSQFYKVGLDNAPAVLHDLRRHPGQQFGRRPVTDAHGTRHRQFGLVHHARRRRLPDRGRSDRCEHRLLAVPARRAGALRPAHRRSSRYPAAGRTRRFAAALELGFAAAHQSAPAHAAVLRRAAPVPQR